MAAPFSAASFETISPAATIVSLLASAMFLPASSAASVGLSPAAPTIAETTISASAIFATAQAPSMPCTISGRCAPRSFASSPAASALRTDTTFGRNRSI